MVPEPAMSAPLLLLWADAWIDVDAARAIADGHFQLSTQRTDFARADAVIFPIPTVGRTIPAQRAFPQQLWVQWSQESAVHYPQLLEPTFNARFDLRMTYQLDSDIPIPYLTADIFDRIGPPPPVLGRDEALASAWVSSTWDRCDRDQYLLALMERLPIDSYGRVGHNRDLAKDHGWDTKMATIGRYPFTIAFENSIATDYVTEKFFQPLLAGSVPIYRGAPNVADFAPSPDSYLDATDFDSPRALAEFVRQMTDEQYLGYHRWRADGPTTRWRARFAAFDTHALVRLGRVVRTVNIGRQAAARLEPT